MNQTEKVRACLEKHAIKKPITAVQLARLSRLTVEQARNSVCYLRKKGLVIEGKNAPTKGINRRVLYKLA